MVNLVIVPADLSTADRLANQLRDADRREIIATGATDVGHAIRRSVELSIWSYAVFDGDALVCIVGVAAVSLLSGIGTPWLLATDHMARLSRDVIVMTGRFVELMHQDFSVLVNWVDARNTRSIRWLKWAGFTVGQPQAVGAGGALFCRFSKEI